MKGGRQGGRSEAGHPVSEMNGGNNILISAVTTITHDDPLEQTPVNIH